MTFIDRATIRVTAGHGGSGIVSFRREIFVPKGGPDGGDGGWGGSVWVKADPQLSTLLDYQYRTHFKAERGDHGGGSNRTGRSGEDIELPVPLGTEIRDTKTGSLIKEILKPADRVLVAKGGRGGRGNTKFATSTHQAPREWEPGEEGQDLSIDLVLKLIADVGLLGEPNAGKSTLLSVVSAAKPKIANYPFTTLAPQLGVVGLADSRGFVMADIPGIIEGAHEGKGLGDKFLQHIERTRVLAYLVPLDAEDPQGVYDLLRHEAAEYAETLAAKPHIVVFSKRDLFPAEDDLPKLDAPDARAVVAISAATNSGLDTLKDTLWDLVNESRAIDAQPADTPF